MQSHWCHPFPANWHSMTSVTVHEDIKKRNGLSQQTCTVLLLDPSWGSLVVAFPWTSRILIGRFPSLPHFQDFAHLFARLSARQTWVLASIALDSQSTRPTRIIPSPMSWWAVSSCSNWCQTCGILVLEIMRRRMMQCVMLWSSCGFAGWFLLTCLFKWLALNRMRMRIAATWSFFLAQIVSKFSSWRKLRMTVIALEWLATAMHLVVSTSSCPRWKVFRLDWGNSHLNSVCTGEVVVLNLCLCYKMLQSSIGTNAVKRTHNNNVYFICFPLSFLRASQLHWLMASHPFQVTPGCFGKPHLCRWENRLEARWWMAHTAELRCRSHDLWFALQHFVLPFESDETHWP